MLHIRSIHGSQVRHHDLGELEQVLGAPGVCWLDVEAPTAQEQQVLRDPALGLHPLIVEDMLDDVHLPKVEVQDPWLLLVVHGLRLRTVAVEIDTCELDIAIGDRLLITYHSEPLASVDAVRSRLDATAAMSVARPMELVHLLLDATTDVFIPFLGLLEERLDVIEEDILTQPTERTRREIYELQRDVIQLRRVVVPQAEVIRRLSREQVGLVTDADRTLFRDVYDHLYRMAELSDSYRQLLDSAMQSYRSSLDDDLNEMLTTLTVISAVLLPVSVIAGIYGTNFEYIPELEWRWGYLAMWGVILSVVAGMLTWFRRRGWVGRRAERAAERRREGLAAVLDIPVLGSVLSVPLRGTRRVARQGRALSRLARRWTRDAHRD